MMVYKQIFDIIDSFGAFIYVMNGKWVLALEWVSEPLYTIN